MSKRYYTLAEANLLLPEIRQLMTWLRQTREDIALRRLRMERLRREETGPGDPDRFFTEEAQIEFLILSARQQIDHLAVQGVEVKDIDAGLVDFLTLVDGEEAYLCWRAGEPEIRYWHGIEEGFAGRKRIDGQRPQDDETSDV